MGRSNRSGSYYVIGRNAVRELLRAHPERVRKVIQTPAVAGKIADLSELLGTLRCPTEVIDVERLTALVQSSSHQGLAVEVVPRSPLSLKDFLTGSSGAGLVLMLDSISDPQNFGALLRVAECFQLQGVIYSKNRGSGLTAAVSKASAGASELVTLVEVSNLSQAVRELKKAEYWITVADSDPEAVSLFEFSFPERSVLVLGSEGSGPQKLLKDMADFVTAIPMLGQIDSLNVSQACAVMAATYVREHRRAG